MQTNREWAQLNFGACQLGDKRRTARLVQVATAVANNPAASFPDQMPTWSDLKAAYDLFDDDDVTFEAIAGTHGEQTKQRSGWVVRAAQLNRYVLAGAAEQRMKLSEYLPQLELRGTYELSLRARPGQKARTAGSPFGEAGRNSTTSSTVPRSQTSLRSRNK